MIAMPDIRRSRMRVPRPRRRSTREQIVDAVREGFDQGVRTMVDSLRDARGSLADLSLPPSISQDAIRRVPNALAASVQQGVQQVDLPRLPDPRRLASSGRVDIRVPDVELTGLGGRVKVRSRSAGGGAATPGAVLGAVLVGMLAGMWLATWPATSSYVRAFFDTIRDRLGLSDGWSADSARKALRRIDERTAEWRDGPLSRRRRRTPAGHETVAGVAVGPGHPDVTHEVGISTGAGGGPGSTTPASSGEASGAGGPPYSGSDEASGSGTRGVDMGESTMPAEGGSAVARPQVVDTGTSGDAFERNSGI